MIRIEGDKIREILDVLNEESSSDGLDDVENYREKVEEPFVDFVFLEGLDHSEEMASTFKNYDSVVESGGVELEEKELGKITYAASDLRHMEIEKGRFATAEDIDELIRLIEKAVDL